MDPFQKLIAEFVPADMPTFDRGLVIKLMGLAWEQSRNVTLTALLGGKNENSPNC